MHPSITPIFFVAIVVAAVSRYILIFMCCANVCHANGCDELKSLMLSFILVISSSILWINKYIYIYAFRITYIIEHSNLWVFLQPIVFSTFVSRLLIDCNCDSIDSNISKVEFINWTILSSVPTRLFSNETEYLVFSS